MFIRHILVATDFSDRSRSALCYAVHLAREMSAEIDLLHVLPASPKSEMVIDAYLRREPALPSDADVADAQRRLKQLLSAVPHEGVRVTPLVESGDAATTIVRVAGDLPSDVVVIGTHGRTGITEMVLGSVAHRVVTTAPCPVLTLRSDFGSSTGA